MIGIDIDYRTAIVLVGAGAALIWWQQRQVEKLVDAVAAEDGALNPTNEDNVINSAFDSAWQTMSGSDESFGADLYDLFHTGSIYN